MSGIIVYLKQSGYFTLMMKRVLCFTNESIYFWNTARCRWSWLVKHLPYTSRLTCTPWVKKRRHYTLVHIFA